MRLVLDAGAYVFATTERAPEARSLLHRIGSSACHVPHLFDAEVGNVLRRKVNDGMPVVQAEKVLDLAAVLVGHRYDHSGPMMAMAWQLRANLTFYDALYVALAAMLAVPLLTVDARLSRAPGLPCRVEVVG
jgi:predicted nucleic acid-binding protein